MQAALKAGDGPGNSRSGGAAAALLGAVMLLCCATGLAAVDPNAKGKGQNYSWVDKNGERHYGDAVPPEYAQAERRVLNSQGVELQHVGAELTPAQQAEAQKQQQAAQQRAQHDNFLVSTYTSTKDIERLRDERDEQLSGQITAAVAYIDSLDTRLKALQQRALMFKPYSKSPDAQRMPDDLAEQLVRTGNELRSQRRSLERRRQEQSSTRAQFDADIVRYRELTAGPQVH
jgi:hypothetical protein